MIRTHNYSAEAMRPDRSLEDIEAKKRLADALMRGGMDYSPVEHWTQAAARVAQAISGSLNRDQASAEDAKLRGDANSMLANILGGGSVTGGASPAGAPPAGVVQGAQADMTPKEPLTDTELGVAKFAAPGLAGSIPKVASALAPDLVESVKKSEGYSAKPYWDYKQWTNGYGTRANGRNDVVDRAGAEARLNSELSKAQAIVDKVAPNAPLGVKKALTSLTYNAGADWVNAGLGDAVRRGDWQDAERRFLQYTRAGGKQLAGLVERRRNESQWFRDDPNRMALGGPKPEAGAQPQLPGGVQVADASGQTVDAATLQRMLANPYTRPMAEKLIQQRLSPAKDDTPANVREWEYFSKLSPEKQAEYLKVKRAEKFLDLDTSYRNTTTGETFQRDVAGKQRQEEIGTAQGKQIAAAPGDVASADTAIELIDSIRNDPNREWGTGISSIFNFFPGSPGRDFQGKVNQARSGAFLTAIQQLRGMGALSNAEGQTATDAVTRIETATSESGFLSALADYEKVVRRGRSRAEAILQGTQSRNYPTPSQPQSPDLKSKYGLE